MSGYKVFPQTMNYSKYFSKSSVLIESPLPVESSLSWEVLLASGIIAEIDLRGSRTNFCVFSLLSGLDSASDRKIMVTNGMNPYSSTNKI